MSGFEPQTFGKYYLVDKVAVGGMAEIFKAKSFGHGGFEKLLIIKRILSHLSENDDFVEMFVDEAKVSVSLQHANIIQTFDFGKVAQNWYIAMECVEGKDVKALLRKLAQRRKLLPIEFAVFVAHEVCKGLDYAHRREDIRGRSMGIVHRDMSPSNALISYEGEVKIADFGIAKARSNTYTTKDGVLKGKFEYMSPEQAAGQEIDRRSDIFSIGIILYECLTGRRLFKASSEVKTLETIKACDIDPPSVLNPAIPSRLDEIVMRALSRRPEDRYQEARELQNDLLEFLYPATPDLTRQSFSHFLREFFAEEIADERRRLEEGSRQAAAMYAEGADMELEPDWEEGSTSGSLGAEQQRQPMPLALLLGMAGVVVVGLLAFLFFSRGAGEEVAPPSSPETASLTVVLKVPGQFFINQEPVGEGRRLDLAALDPGEHMLRIEAEGHLPYEDSLVVAAGESIRIPVSLVPAPEPEPDPPPRSQGGGPVPAPPDPPPEENTPDASDPGPTGPTGTSAPEPAPPPRVSFVSSPSGAGVYVNGRRVGQTPMAWTGGSPGASVRVEYRLADHEPASFSLTVPQEGGSADASRSLRPEAKEPGHISVNVSRNWAHVYVDGKKLGETTPLNSHPLPAGTYLVRVANEALGIDASRRITVQPGQTEKVFFRLD